MIRVSNALMSGLEKLDSTANSAKYGFISGQKKVIDAYNAGKADRDILLSHNQVVTEKNNVYKKQYSQRDFLKTNDYNVYTCVITGYDKNNAAFKSRMESDLVVRPFIEYVDANGTTRTYYRTDDLAYNENTKSKTVGGAYYTNLKYTAEYIITLPENEGPLASTRERIYYLYLQPYYLASQTLKGIENMTWEEFVAILEQNIIENSYLDAFQL
jgi:hypothetical protein